MVKKATMATIKSFIRKNQGRLYIREKSSFDGMTDCCEYIPERDRKFVPVAIPARHPSNDFGVGGAWFVGGSRDSIMPIDEPGWVGFHVYNCCGSFDLAVRS
jgi:hypothetical protein